MALSFQFFVQMLSEDFKVAIEKWFVPFLNDFNISLTQFHINGKYFDAHFEGRGVVVSISFEPGDDYLTLRVYELKNKDLSYISGNGLKFDMNMLMKLFGSKISSQHYQRNKEYFENLTPEGEMEKRFNSSNEAKQCHLSLNVLCPETSSSWKSPAAALRPCMCFARRTV